MKCVQAVMLIRLRRNSLARYSHTSTQASSQPLTTGENVPAFEARILYDKRVNLQTYRGNPLLLIFFQPAPILTEHFFH